MSYIEKKGNIFNSKAYALVNTVNCVGAMGKGIALEFKRRYPEMFEQYTKDCKTQKLKPGNVYYYSHKDRLILNFAIKDDWKFPSKIQWVESCLKQFTDEYRQKNIRSVAFPWMGAMNGRIPLSRIQEVTRRYLRNLTDIDIEVYEFDPGADDPLFDRLRKFVNDIEPESFSKKSGLRRTDCFRIFEEIKNGNICSLPKLVASGIIGKKSIDKLYKFLTNNSTGNVSKQLTLF